VKYCSTGTHFVLLDIANRDEIDNIGLLVEK